jgi:hypothetical protein
MNYHANEWTSTNPKNCRHLSRREEIRKNYKKKGEERQRERERKEKQKDKTLKKQKERQNLKYLLI